VAEARVAEALQRLRDAGYPEASAIGSVVEAENKTPLIRLR
jgi:hypothetical protein